MVYKKKIEEFADPIPAQDQPKTPEEQLSTAIKEGELDGKKIKRHRRTREELENEKRRAEQKQLDHTNYEIFAQLMKMISDADVKRYGFPAVPISEFEPLGKQYAIICNYYMPAGKPIYFVMASATLQTFMMLKNRSNMITALTQGKNNADTPDVSAGEVRFGQEFPSQTPVKSL